jgi:predicted ribosomally synthesized peptide with nif11-like leader
MEGEGGLMSIESAKAYVERVKTDEEFARRVSEAASREERAEIARSEGFDFTPEELKTEIGELSEEELEAVAGGRWCGYTHESEPCGECGPKGPA